MTEIKSKYLPGDVVYDNVTVPNGIVIEETYNPELNHIVICIRDGQPRRPITMKGFNEDDPFEILSRDDMRKKIVSGFIDHYRK